MTEVVVDAKKVFYDPDKVVELLKSKVYDLFFADIMKFSAKIQQKQVVNP